MPRFYSKKRCAPYCDWRDVYLEEIHRGAHAENGQWVHEAKAADDGSHQKDHIMLARAA